MGEVHRRPKTFSGATGTAAGIITVATGTLTANVTKTVTHGMGVSDYQLEVSNGDNNVAVNKLKKNASNPTTQFDIEVGVDLPAGLNVSVIGG